MRCLKSALVGFGLYLLAVAVWDVLVWLYLQVHFRHGLAGDKVFIVVQPVFMPHSRLNDLHDMLPLIIGHVIGIAAFVAGFYWMFRRTEKKSE